MRNLSHFVSTAAIAAALATPTLAWEAADNGGRTRAFVNGNGDLNLRAWPAPQSQLLVKLPQGTRVEADRCIHPEKVQDHWCHVRYGGYVGWVDAAFLQEVSGYAGQPPPPVVANPPPPVVVTPSPPPPIAPPPPPGLALASPAAAQQQIPVPPEFVGRWATVYIPMCAARGGCSSDRAFLPVVSVITRSGDSYAEMETDKHFPIRIFPDPQGRAGYYRVVENGAVGDFPDSDNIQHVYRSRGHIYRDTEMQPTPDSDEFDNLMRESGLSDEDLARMRGAPQMNTQCRLRDGSNADCE